MKKVKVIFRQVTVVSMLLLLLVAMDWSNAACGGQKAGSTGGATREPYDLDIYTHQNGTVTYIIGVALSDILNEKLPWMRSVAVESMSSLPNELMMYEADDYKRKHTLYFGIGDLAWKGTGVFEGKQNKRSKIAFCFQLVCGGVLTANPSINRL